MAGQTTVVTPPADPTAAQVAQVREFNRFYTKVIGVVQGMYLEMPYTITEGRLLFEIARQDMVPVSGLRQVLDIDAGYLSRVLSRFEADGLITRHRSASDARRQDVRLTDAGRAVAAELDARAIRQIGGLLDGVDTPRLLEAMRVITDMLNRQGNRDVTLRPLAIGDLGWVLQRHGIVYAAEFGWNSEFEDLCAGIVAEFVAKRDRAPGRTAGWVAEVDGVPAGFVCCVPDGDDDSEVTARLRMLLVESWARGLGIGTRLVDECLRFAREAGYRDIVLLTYDQLASARRIYQAAGFTLASEYPEDAFGQHMMCQTWSRTL